MILKLSVLFTLPLWSVAQDACISQKQAYQSCVNNLSNDRLALADRFNRVYQQCGLDQCYQELSASTRCSDESGRNYGTQKLLCKSLVPSTVTVSPTLPPLVLGRRKRDADAGEQINDRVKRHRGGGRNNGFAGDFGFGGGRGRRRGRRFTPSCQSLTTAQRNCTRAATTALYQDQTFIQLRNTLNLGLTQCSNLITIPRWQCRQSNNNVNAEYCNCKCTARTTKDQEFFNCYQQAIPGTAIAAPTAQDCTLGCSGRRGRNRDGRGRNFDSPRYDSHQRG